MNDSLHSLPSEKTKLILETMESLSRIQELDPDSISQTENLGKALSFSDGVPHLARTIELFREISSDALIGLSTAKLTSTKQQADSLYNLVSQILKFTPASGGNIQNTRNSLIQQLVSSYDQYFEELWPAIAYSARRQTDFSRMEREARAAIQSISDRTRDVELALNERASEAESTLDTIRRVAAEQGVSQQAIYFKEESELHAKLADQWLLRTTVIGISLGSFAILASFLHKFPWLIETPADAIQVGISKMLVFGTITYFMILSARSYMSHRHNSVVNKHRQNSLVTYKALVDAAGDSANSDIILTRAADSIFGQQSTGFTRSDTEDGRALSMVSFSANALRNPTPPA